MGAEQQIRAAYGNLWSMYRERRRAVAGVAELARVRGVPFAQIAGADMARRLEVADSVAARLFAAFQQLEAGTAAIVPWRGDFAIIPAIALEPYRATARVLAGDDDEDGELGVWPVWLIAAAIAAAVVVVAIVAYVILEVTTATAQNEQAARDLHGRAARWMADQIIAHPEQAGAIADAFNRGLSQFAPGGGSYGGSPPTSPWTAAAGGAGLALGLGLVLLIGSKRGGSSGRRRNGRIAPRL